MVLLSFPLHTFPRRLLLPATDEVYLQTTEIALVCARTAMCADEASQGQLPVAGVAVVTTIIAVAAATATVTVHVGAVVAVSLIITAFVVMAPFVIIVAAPLGRLAVLYKQRVTSDSGGRGRDWILTH